MITLKQFMEVSQYRITEGSDFGWTCFGDNAYSISAWNGDQDGWSLIVTFDTRTQEVYLVESCDYRRNRAYRFINPIYKDDFFAYGKKHHEKYMNEAWDKVNYTDLEVAEDWLEKSSKIVADEDYDTKVTVPLELPDNELFTLMKMAHERNTTFNQLIEDILWIAIQDAERKVA
jgi:hypothetical protein